MMKTYRDGHISLIFTLFALLLLIGSCKSNNQNAQEKNFEIPDSVKEIEEEIEVSDEAMESIVQNIASPVEIAAQIKSLGIPFSKEYLASTDIVNQLESDNRKALNLGVYGTNLGYINMYQQQSLVIEYIKAIKTLADGINVGQFFEFSTLKRLSKNSQNLDSLMYISVQNFNNMDNYLRENDRGDISSIMIAGAWIEGLYIATQVAKLDESGKLKQSIGEQKTILNELMLILKNYKNNEYIAEVINEISPIKKA
ncbi:MAG: hypothetical protein ACOC4B_01075, partial [Bacteroidota bacterium]